MYNAIMAVQTPSQRLSSNWMYYIIRASGFIAIVLLVLLMLSGIGHVTGFTYKFVEPIKAWTLHKAMGIALGISILIHVSLLLVDKYANYNIIQVLVPFTKSYSNNTTLFGSKLVWLSISSGVVAMYGSYLVLFSSLDTVGWIRTHKRLWRWIHWVSYLTIFLALIHGILAGIDLRTGWLRWVWLLITIIIGIGIVSRVLRSNRADAN